VENDSESSGSRSADLSFFTEWTFSFLGADDNGADNNNINNDRTADGSSKHIKVCRNQNVGHSFSSDWSEGASSDNAMAANAANAMAQHPKWPSPSGGHFVLIESRRQKQDQRERI
jgi:hypothetical protein